MSEGQATALTESAFEIAGQVRRGERSASEVLETRLRHIEEIEPVVRAWRHLDLEGARAQARAVDERRAAGQSLGPLAGVPVGLKDLFVTQGMQTGAGSKILQGWVPGYQGTHAQRLAQADAVIVGKLAMDEFAMGSSNENSPYAPVRNPWSLAHVPGGSSGGSAAAVAARMCPLTLGSDTGGSIRQPASLCGVTGLKPSYGRVSRHGMIAFASSFDQAGPMALRVGDLATAFEVLAGPDPRDASCANLPVPPVHQELTRGVDAMDGLRVGVHREALDHEGLDPKVRACFEASLAHMAKAGAQIVDVELPHFDLAIACYYVLSTAEAASNLARFDGLRFGARPPGATPAELERLYAHTRAQGMGDEVKRRIMLGTFVLRADSYELYYGRAMKVRRLIANDYAQAFATCDVLASPVSPVAGFRLGERVDDPLAMYLSDVFTIGVNLAGLPALAMPSGFAEVEGVRLPVGLQFIAPAFEEARLFAAAGAYEAMDPHHQVVPPLLAPKDADAGGQS